MLWCQGLWCLIVANASWIVWSLWQQCGLLPKSREAKPSSTVHQMQNLFSFSVSWATNHCVQSMSYQKPSLLEKREFKAKKISKRVKLESKNKGFWIKLKIGCKVNPYSKINAFSLELIWHFTSSASNCSTLVQSFEMRWKASISLAHASEDTNNSKTTIPIWCFVALLLLLWLDFPRHFKTISRMDSRWGPPIHQQAKEINSASIHNRGEVRVIPSATSSRDWDRLTTHHPSMHMPSSHWAYDVNAGSFVVPSSWGSDTRSESR